MGRERLFTPRERSFTGRFSFSRLVRYLFLAVLSLSQPVEDLSRLSFTLFRLVFRLSRDVKGRKQETKGKSRTVLQLSRPGKARNGTEKVFHAT
jgi:hypothetical protein